MDVEFDDPDLDRLEVDPAFNGGYAKVVVKAYRKRMQLIRAAPTTQQLYAMKSLHFEKLAGEREGERSIRLNDQWRLILEIKDSQEGQVARVIEITNHYE
jgi:proteic killer suppression protein